ncbi:MAG: hypothetical protein ACRD9L_22785, partial [Bryobacteraceae bacterium]
NQTTPTVLPKALPGPSPLLRVEQRRNHVVGALSFMIVGNPIYRALSQFQVHLILGWHRSQQTNSRAFQVFTRQLPVLPSVLVVLLLYERD